MEAVNSDQELKMPYVIAISSGKGGVGKSMLAANIANTVAKMGYSVLLWDANMQFPNLHLLIGVEPYIRLDEVYSGNIRAEQAYYKVRDGFFLLADTPAVDEAKDYIDFPIVNVYQQILLDSDFDLIVIDTPAGAGDVVMQVANIADEVNIVVTDEPTSLLDAYGLIKLFLQTIDKDKINLLVNNVIDYEDGNDIAHKLNLATEKFLGFMLEVKGLVPYDRAVRRSIINQELLTDTDAEGEVITAIKAVCERIINTIELTKVAH